MDGAMIWWYDEACFEAYLACANNADVWNMVRDA